MQYLEVRIINSHLLLRVCRPLLVTLLLLLAQHAFAQKEAMGFWMNEQQDMVVEIYLVKGEMLHGRVVWLRDSLDITGQPARDVMNPQPIFRTGLIKGMDVLRDFEWKNEAWRGGKIYNWQTGHTYNGKITIEEDGSLRLSGYYGILFFLGKTKHWTRTRSPFDRSASP